ncbi:MAG: hypothetical protein H6Q89_1297 [Myxococcaceae bacterium]|nr:hypothetical protein [Myxococcaceae bacterium]
MKRIVLGCVLTIVVGCGGAPTLADAGAGGDSSAGGGSGGGVAGGAGGGAGGGVAGGAGGGVAGGAGGGVAGGAGGGVAGGAGGGTATDAGTPIAAPNETWTWVDFPGSACGNGVATGIGVNLTSQSTDVVIYLQGGGACWDNTTCFVINSAANVSSGYGATQFASDTSKGASFFDRSRTDNPFRTASFVFVPYCTGDVHGGDAVQTYNSALPNKKLFHKGRVNLAEFLARLKPTFPAAQHVYLSGSSAGAFGAQINYPQVAAAFPSAEVHLLADSGQMINPSGTLLSTWVASWALVNPVGCANCYSDFTKLPQWLAATYPNRRFALLAYTQDNVLRQFFAYSAVDYETQTRALLTAVYNPTTHAKYFLLAGTSHTMLGSFFTLTAPSGGPTLATWVTRWKNGDAAWANVLAP